MDNLFRNLAYFFMIVRLINHLGQDVIGGYYLAMHIFWTFLLVPVLALTEGARVLMANSCGDLQRLRGLWYSAWPAPSREGAPVTAS